jgi:hypothetical protein
MTSRASCLFSPMTQPVAIDCTVAAGNLNFNLTPTRKCGIILYKVNPTPKGNTMQKREPMKPRFFDSSRNKICSEGTTFCVNAHGVVWAYRSQLEYPDIHGLCTATVNGITYTEYDVVLDGKIIILWDNGQLLPYWINKNRYSPTNYVGINKVGFNALEHPERIPAEYRDNIRNQYAPYHDLLAAALDRVDGNVEVRKEIEQARADLERAQERLERAESKLV